MVSNSWREFFGDEGTYVGKKASNFYRANRFGDAPRTERCAGSLSYAVRWRSNTFMVKARTRSPSNRRVRSFSLRDEVDEALRAYAVAHGLTYSATIALALTRLDT